MESLTDDLVRECLLRVPYTSHEELKAVCRSWEDIVRSPEFYVDRKISGKSEQIICLIQRYWQHSISRECAIRVYDPVKGTWQKLTPIDGPLMHELFPIDHRDNTEVPEWCKCVVVNRKLVLICDFYFYKAKSVYIYDFESARWSRGADMPRARSFFACSVSSSNGLVYVAGGIDRRGNALAAAEVYDVEENKWEILPHMIRRHQEGCHGVFMQGKFMVIGGGVFDRSADVFDPGAGTWRRLEDMWSWRRKVPWKCCMVVSSSHELYAFSEKQVMKYDSEKNVWSVVASLPQYIANFTCATQWRDCIFVSGVTAVDFIDERSVMTAIGLIDEHSQRFISYLFNPSTGRFTEVDCNGGEGFETRRWGRVFPGMVTCAATLVI